MIHMRNSAHTHASISQQLTSRTRWSCALVCVRALWRKSCSQNATTSQTCVSYARNSSSLSKIASLPQTTQRYSVTWRCLYTLSHFLPPFSFLPFSLSLFPLFPLFPFLDHSLSLPPLYFLSPFLTSK